MKKNLDMTEGKPISLLWAFTFPTLMGNLLNQVYSITDSIVVGRYLGQTALAAVGSTMPVILLLAALMIGINVGVGIIISRYFGQKNEELMRRAFVNSLYLGLFLSAGMMVMGLTFSGTILRWMGTPEGPLQEATAYLEISFITMICPLMYYLFSSAFRGLGDSQTALYCLIVSVLSNIGLDVLFVAVFRWGVAGSAWATALAQALSAVVAAVLVLVVYPLMEEADRRPVVLTYTILAMVVCSGAFVGYLYLRGDTGAAAEDTANYLSALENGWKLLGATLGMLVSNIADRKHIRFETQAVWWAQLIKLAVGFGCLLAIRSGLKAPLIALLGGNAAIAGGIRYLLVVLFAGCVWPLTFWWFSRLGRR